MNTNNCARLPLVFLLPAMALVLGCPPTVEPLVIPAGEAYSITDPTTTSFRVETPEGFFSNTNNVLSDALARDVALEGVPLNMDGTSTILRIDHSFHSAGSHSHGAQQASSDFPTADTILYHGGTELAEIGSVATVDLRMVALSLKSVDSLQVAYGNEAPSNFNMVIVLDDSVQQGDGWLELTRTGDNSGTYRSSFPLDILSSFTNLVAAGPSAIMEPQIAIPEFDGEGDFSVEVEGE